MASALSAKYDVTALAMTQRGGKPFFYMSPKVHFIHMDHCYGKQKNLVHKILRSFRIRKLQRRSYDQQYEDPVWGAMMEPVIRQTNPDVIVAFSLDLARMILQWTDTCKPVIVMFHQSSETVLKNLTPASKRALEEAACVQVLMKSDLPVVQKRAACRRLVCIPNAIVVPEYASSLKNKKIVHMARFNRNTKRQHLLIEAFRLLHPAFPGWKLELWGDGDPDHDTYTKYCYDLVKQAGLEHEISFCGTTRQVEEVLSEGSIFAFPSSEEGMGICLAEAMAVGLPAVGYRSCHAVNEIIRDKGNGFLCEDGVEPFAEALRRLMSDEGLRKKMGYEAKRTAEAYEASKIWGKWGILLEETASGR